MTIAVDGVYWDDGICAHVVKETDEWIVAVAPMIFNDRVLFMTRREYPVSWSAGWCYDQGGAAIFAALAWDPDTEHSPVGYKKVAGDSRP